MTKTKRLKPLAVLKAVGPKLVPFFKTVAIFFVLFGREEACSILFCVAKCLPIASLMGFVLLHGMGLDECYRYSRRILIGLVFSVLGDIFLVWKHSFINFELGLLSFAIAQAMYSLAFGWRHLKLYVGAVFFSVGLSVYTYLSLFSSMSGVMIYLTPLYIALISTMAWRAVARVQIYDDLWTWTKLCGCIGAVCFMVSDLVIALNMFAFSVPCAHQVIMVTYYVAQCGISLSVVDSQADEMIKHDDDDDNDDEDTNDGDDGKKMKMKKKRSPLLARLRQAVVRDFPMCGGHGMKKPAGVIVAEGKQKAC